MDNLKHAKLQHDIKNSSEEMKNSLMDLYRWETEMKEKDKALLKGGQSEDNSIPAVRSVVDDGAKILGETNKTSLNASLSAKIKQHDLKDESSDQTKGNLSKDKGNSMVKDGKFEEAVYFYTDAINHYNKDPIFYTNRALCYLKMEKFDQCIKDCNKAIDLNKTTVKAYYRRMQAYECLGENEKALDSCRTVLKLDSKNTEAKHSYQRISQRISKLDDLVPSPKPVFTKTNENMAEIEVFNKPAHLRSKKPMKSVEIKEVIGEKGKIASDSQKNVHISDEILDKLFNNNNVGSYTEIKKSTKIQDKASFHDMNLDNDNKVNISNTEENEHLETEYISESKKIFTENKLSENIVKKYNGDSNKELQVPTSPAQFHTTWKDLTAEQRYVYLKKIHPSNLNKVLGAGLEPDMLTDIFNILKDFYVRDNCEIIEILKEISKHDEFNILSLFLSKDDREAMADFVTYMKARNNDQKDIDYIECIYYLKKN